HRWPGFGGHPQMNHSHSSTHSSIHSSIHSSTHELRHPGFVGPDADYYRESMQKGSVSFTLAARLFDASQQAAVQKLYAWCRYCDDQIDEVPDQAEAGRRLELLRKQTAAALRGEATEHPEFAGLQSIAQSYGVPAEYAFELLAGFEMDVFHQRYAQIADLELYCHRVAGVVGLMMTHIMGISDTRALAYADASGRALQLTNIARDVLEDLGRGRLYLPLSWFEELGLAAPQHPQDFSSEAVYPVVERLLDHARAKYAQARLGLDYLPLRPALAVSAALEVYGGIGTAIR
ncbi:MAG: hypothetical protein CVV27_19615, partial [Candidatus Melainabacteria bacterium HGW-Melainabacteria-1]